MVKYDPGPPPDVADHLDRVPSYAAHQDLFWYDWGRSSIVDDLIDPPGCYASPRIPGQQSESQPVRWSATQASVSRASSASWA